MFSDFVINANKNTRDQVLRAIVTAFYARNWYRTRSKMLFSHSLEKAQFLISDVTNFTFKMTVKGIGKDSVYVFNSNPDNTNKGIDWINSFLKSPISKIMSLSSNNMKRLSVMVQRHKDDSVFNQITDSFTRTLNGGGGNLFDSIDADNKYYNDDVYDLDRLANQASTSSQNDLPNPSQEDKENNNYQTGNVEIAGLQIAIENPAGSIRSGVSEDGTTWQTEMKHHYGYIENTLGSDGDEIDVFVKAGLTHFNGKVFIVRQLDKNGEFDEHKLVLGADNADEAKQIYLSNYKDDWTGFGDIEEISISELKSRLNHQWSEFDSIGIDLKNAVVDPSNAVPILNQLMSAIGLPQNDKTMSYNTNSIQDFGAKIGGARKDLVGRISKRIKNLASEQKKDIPTWAKRFEIAEDVVSGKWVVFDKKKKSYFGGNKVMGNFETEQDAENALPLIAVGMNHGVYDAGDNKYAIYKKVNDRKRVQVVERLFDDYKEALEYMAENAKNILDVNTTFGEADIPKPSSNLRVGKTYRDKDATGEDFMSSFAFRGVEFGNWNNQTERQELLNDAYDGLMDLSNTLGVEPKSLSLGGDLALAFGARGKGLSGASAHYEPAYSVINLTKKNGSGTLAHEWLHAFDHYLGRLDGKASSEWIEHSDGTKTLETQANNDDYVSEGFGYKSKLPESLRNAWKDLQATIRVRSKEVAVNDDITIKAYDTNIERAKSSLDYNFKQVKGMLELSLPNRSRNKLPATPEQMADFEKYKNNILNGNTKTESQDNGTSRFGSYSYRNTNEDLDAISEILKKVRGTTGFTSQHDGLLNKVANSMDSVGRMLSAKQRYLSEKEEKGEVRKLQRSNTDFLAHAILLDKGRGSDYWSSKVELMARAFQGYIEDRVKDQGGSSPFLNYAPQSAGLITPWGNNFIYPRGEERTAINKAFDKFFDEVRKHDIL